MANPLIIVLSGGVAQGNAKAAVLIDTPAGNNSAGISFSTAVVLSGLYPARSSAPPGDGTNGTIGAQERANLVSGTRVEAVRTFSFGGDWASLTGPQKAAQIDAWALALQTEVQAQITSQLDEVGRNRQVP